MMMKTPSVVTIELELVYPSFGPFTAPGSHSPDLSHTQTYFNAQNFTLTSLRYRQLVETAHFAMPPSHRHDTYVEQGKAYSTCVQFPGSNLFHDNVTLLDQKSENMQQHKLILSSGQRLDIF